MESLDWRVIVLRAWRDAGGVRVRILIGDGTSRRSLVATGAEAGVIVQRLVSELDANVDPESSVFAPPAGE
jgi:hypothetical protein